MELKNIKTFLRVAELGSLTKAAMELGYSQSTITVQIKQLENELGFLLFDRIGKNISLTSQGNEFVTYANKFIHLEAEALRLFAKDSAVTGTLRIGVPESLLVWKMPSVLLEYHKQYPDVNVEITVTNSYDGYRLLKENRIDVLYLLDDLAGRKDYKKIIIDSVESSFVTYSDNPLCNERQISLADLAKEALVLPERHAIYRRYLDMEAARFNVDLTPILEIDNIEAILRLLKIKMGTSFIPNFVAQEHINSGALSILDVDVPACRLWCQIVFHKNKFISPPIEAFILLLKNMQ